MLVSLDWLKEFLDLRETPAEIADILTMLGLEAEPPGERPDLAGIISTRILAIQPHPRAEKLQVCRISDGKDTYSVVCGAPNLKQGLVAPFAPAGTVLPDGIRVTTVKIRGVDSMGMLCSEKELGVSGDHSGIMMLPEDVPPGRSLETILQEQRATLDLDITPNRPDCLSHLGIARELALKLDRPLRKPVVKIQEAEGDAIQRYVSVRIDDTAGCPRYIAGVVRNVSVKPSPSWVAARLEAAGQRSINNIVDISNFVLLEMGHPTHIFDYQALSGKEIVIRRAHPGEVLVTLDGEMRTLEQRHLLITDGANPIAIAGIMGGYTSAVSEKTSTVLIESAYFDPATIRIGSKSLGLMSEASRRFERGADPEGAVTAFWRVIELLETYAGGEFVPGMIDAYPAPLERPRIRLRKSELDLLSGCVIPDEFVEKVLRGLEIEIQKQGGDSWSCRPPSFRPDLEREVDLIEEIVRIFGYEQVPASKDFVGFYRSEAPDERAGIADLIHILTGAGFHQCYTNTLQSEHIARSSEVKPVRLLNPLGEEMACTRTSLLPGLIQVLDFNIKNHNPDLELFEIGQVFRREAPGLKGIVETLSLAGLVHGLQALRDIHTPADREHSLFSIKGYLDLLLRRLHCPEYELIHGTNPVYGIAYRVRARASDLGWCGIISTEFIRKTGSETGMVAGFELDLGRLLDMMDREISYHPVPSFPRVERDLNFVISESVPAQDLVEEIRRQGGELLRQVTPVNVYRHESLGAGHKSITVHMVFQSSQKTLEDKDVSPIIDEIIAVTKKRFHAKLRS